MDLIRVGTRALSGGARRGSALVAGLGAAATIVGLMRRFARPRRRLLYARTLKPGETLRIRHTGGRQEVEIDA